MAATLLQLHEAEAAYHNYLTGSQAVEITDQNGERVRFTAINISQLRMYIDSLRAELFPESATRRTNGPAGFIF